MGVIIKRNVFLNSTGIKLLILTNSSDLIYKILLFLVSSY